MQLKRNEKPVGSLDEHACLMATSNSTTKPTMLMVILFSCNYNTKFTHIPSALLV